MFHLQLQETAFQRSEESRDIVMAVLQEKNHARNILVSFSSKYSHKNVTLADFVQADTCHGVFGLRKQTRKEKDPLQTDQS